MENYHIKMLRGKSYLCLFWLLMSILTVTNSQRLNVDSPIKVFVEGERGEFLCSAPKQIASCRFKVPGIDNAFYLRPNGPSKNPGFSYIGNGFEAGQCGLLIDEITTKHNGQVECSVNYEDEDLVGVFDVIIGVPPDPPQLEVIQPPPNGQYQLNDLLRARCTTKNGKPPANLTWFLNDEEIYQDVTNVPVNVQQNPGNDPFPNSISQEYQRSLSILDDGKMLICRSTHFADKGQHGEAKIPISVQYGPQTQQGGNIMKIYGLVFHSTTLINVTVHANPEPRGHWDIDGTIINIGDRNGRYEARYPDKIGNNTYNFTLVISELKSEDMSKFYQLKASNPYGENVFKIQLSEALESVETFIDIGAIVGIIAAVVIILAAILLIVFARVTRRWCFADFHRNGNSTNEATDPENCDLKETKRKILPDFRAIIKKRNTKQQSVAIKKEDPSAQNEDEQRLADENLEKSPNETGDENQTNEEKQLVYAELVFNSPDDKPAPQKPSTEYAEIVHFKNPKNDETTNTNEKSV